MRIVPWLWHAPYNIALQMQPLYAMTGTMARRMLVNWRIEPEAARRVLPPVVRPILIDGFASAGLCLVRLERMRLTNWPRVIGLSSENVAARMAIEWDTPAGRRQGVLIFRRDTASRANGSAAWGQVPRAVQSAVA